MRSAWFSGALALAMTFGAVGAHAGGVSGGPVADPGDPGDPGTDPTDPGAGTDPGNGSGTGTGTGTSASASYGYGSGALVFSLDSLPTGPSGTQAFFQPFQDNSALGVSNNASSQGVLTQTVGGTTLSLHTATFVAGGADPMTVIRTDNDGALFGYLGVPGGVTGVGGVGVGIQASTFSGAAPGAVYVNFTDALSYFSVNLYRLSGAFDVGTTVTAYSGLDGTGMVLGSASGSITGGTNFAYATVQLANLAGARSFTLNGTSGLANYDAVTATINATTALPEPATWAMMVGGFGLVGAGLRRRTMVAFG